MVKVSWFKDDFSIVFHSYRSNFSEAREFGIALMRKGWQVTIELDDKEVLLKAC